MALDLPQRGVDDGVWDEKLNTALTQLDNRVVDLENAEPEDVTSDNISDASTVGKAVLTAGGQEEAREAIGAGTSSLELGTSSTTAMAGDTNISDLGGVPDTRSINSKALSSDITLTKSDLGLGNVDNTADSAKVVASAAKLTTARTIAGKSFDGTANISITASDVGAVAEGDLDTSVQTFLDDNNYRQVYILAEGESVPAGLADGTLVVFVAEGSGTPAFAELTSGTDSDGLSEYTTASVDPGTQTSCLFLHVVAGEVDGNAEYPTSVSGAGLTWMPVASVASSLGNMHTQVWQGTGTPSEGAITITFANAMTNCTWRVVEADNIDTAVVQTATATNTSTTPSATLSSPNGGNAVLAFYAQNSVGQTATIGNGYTQLGAQVPTDGGDVPTILIDCMYDMSAQPTVNWTASSNARKTIIALELAPE